MTTNEVGVDLVPPIQMQTERLVRICVKALKHARGDNRRMLMETLKAIGGEAWALPVGFSSQAFDRLAYDTPDDEAELKSDLKAIADYRRPIDGERALVEAALLDGMVLDYDSARFLTKDLSNRDSLVIGGMFRLSPVPNRAGYAVVPK